MNDPCVWSFFFLVLYVDDILLIGNEYLNLLHILKIWLSRIFFMNDVREVTCIRKYIKFA